MAHDRKALRRLVLPKDHIQKLPHQTASTVERIVATIEALDTAIELPAQSMHEVSQKALEIK